MTGIMTVGHHQIRGPFLRCLQPGGAVLRDRHVMPCFRRIRPTRNRSAGSSSTTRILAIQARPLLSNYAKHYLEYLV